jgi:hypothetical protein
VSALEFLSPDLAAPEAVWRSPLARHLEDGPPGVEDLSRTAVLEVRGEVAATEGADIVRLTPGRTLVLCAWRDAARLRAELPGRVVDLSAAYAGLRVPSAAALRRLTDLDLDALPAAGAFAHVEALVLRDGDSFRVYFPQEYSRYVCEVVRDALEGLA